MSDSDNATGTTRPGGDNTGGTTRSAADNAGGAAKSGADGSSKRRVLLIAVVAVFAIGAIGYGLYWLLVGRYSVKTDDAYVGGNMVQITSQVSGTVIGIDADDTEFVSAGQPLIRLDQADARALLDKNEAQLAATVRQVRNLFVHTSELEASVASRRVDLSRAEADLARRQKLASSGAISGEDVQHAREAVQSARAALDGTHEQLAGNETLIRGTSVASHPNVMQAAAEVRSAYLDLARTTIPVPVSGIVAKRAVQIGQRVSPGAPLMAVVPLDQVWVDANFKEGQLKPIRVGQPVRLTADANGFEYHGTVVGFAAGTGAAFAVLPAQNATGNWIKVVQRLPVRVALDPRELAQHPLQIGLSMVVKIDVHDEAARRSEQKIAYRTDVFEQQEQAASTLISDIIARNDTPPDRRH
jgi:membrane fusion protein (multidrug efflux system)